MNNIFNNINYKKLLLSTLGALLIMSTFFISNLYLYFILYAIGWFFILYAIYLQDDSDTLQDVNHIQKWELICAYILLIIGDGFLTYYRIHRKIKITKKYEKTLFMFIGVIFYILSKGLLIIVELNLNNIRQYITILSIINLAIGKILQSIASSNFLYHIATIYYIIGFILFIINVSIKNHYITN